MRSVGPVPRFAAVMLALAIAAPASGGQKWEVDVHGGYVLSSNPSGGAGALPGVNSASAPVVPSWYFGDGALVLNQALTSFGLNAAIVPLGPVLQGPFVERRSGRSFGIRVSRVLTPRFSAEFAFDEAFGALAVTPTSRAAFDRTSDSFVTAWNAALNVVSRLQSPTVTSLATIGDRAGHQRFATGALLINLRSGERLKPYAALGAGVVTNRNGAPTAGLVGRYQFGLVLAPGIPVNAPTFHETDTVTVRSSVDNAFTGALGGGLKYALSERWGVRIDVRDYVSRNRVNSILTATPASERLSPNSVLFIGTTPPLRFSTSPGNPSTLGGTPVSAFTTFRGTGVRHQLKITLAVLAVLAARPAARGCFGGATKTLH